MATGNERLDLLPCPFCGGETWVNHYPDGCYIMCHNGDCIGSLLDASYKTEAKAIAALNTRAERTYDVEVRESAWGGFTRHCGNCWADLDCDTRNRQNYCPNCGRKVDDGEA